MTKNTSVSLGEHFTGFIDAQVATGRFNSTSDVIRAGLRLLEDEQARLAALRSALVEGENSGQSEALDMDDCIRQKRGSATGAKPSRRVPAA